MTEGRGLAAGDQFSGRLLKAIDRGLEPLGESAKRSLYLFARRKHKLPRYEIPTRPIEFMRAVQDVYGRSAVGIERRIVECIATDFALDSVPNSFAEAVELAKRVRPS